MNVILVSYYFREKDKMNFGQYPIVYQLAKKVGHVASSKPFSWRTEYIDGIKVERCFVFRTPFTPDLSQVIFGLGLYKKYKDYEGILHAQGLATGFGFRLLKNPIKVLTLRSLFHSFLDTIPVIRKENNRLFISTRLKLQKMLVESSDFIISPSNYYREEVLKYRDVKEENIRVIPNGIDEKLFSPRESDTDKKIMLFVGGTSKRKGYSFVIDLQKKLKEKYPDLELWIIGDKKQDDRNIGIKFFGRRTYEEMPDFYNKATVFVHPSLNENCPKVILEAMSCEKPVVTLNVTGNVELIDNYVDGIYTSKQNFADEVDSLLEDESLRREIGKNARKKVLKKYTFSNMYKDYLEVYKALGA